jgi:hypothetical protein
VKLATIFFVVTSSIASAQLASAFAVLTDSQVQAAIEQGANGRPHAIGLRLHEVDDSNFSGLSCNTCGQTDYFVTLYTPSEWIEAQATAAKRQKQPFSPANVTEAMRRPVLRVVAVQIRNAGGRSVAPTPIQGVTLADLSKKTVLQPLLDDRGQQSVERNGDRGSINSSVSASEFEMAAVEHLSGNSNGGFFVVVSVSGRTKYMKVETEALEHAF